MKIGDVVEIEATSGMCTGGPEAITNIITKYDESTGEPYEVICFDDHQFDSRTGYPINPPWMYTIQNSINKTK